MEIHVALLQAGEFQRKPDERCVVAVAAADVEDLDRPSFEVLERRDQIAEDAFGQVWDDVVEPAEHAVVLTRIRMRIDAVEAGLGAVGCPRSGAVAERLDVFCMLHWPVSLQAYG